MSVAPLLEAAAPAAAWAQGDLFGAGRDRHNLLELRGVRHRPEQPHGPRASLRGLPGVWRGASRGRLAA
jgi:hypothetical protein